MSTDKSNRNKIHNRDCIHGGKKDEFLLRDRNKQDLVNKIIQLKEKGCEVKMKPFEPNIRIHG